MKRLVILSKQIIPYPSPEDIDKLESDPSDSSVEDAYYKYCIDSIAAGLKGYEWDSDRRGITIFGYDEETGESYDIGFFGNDYIKELEIECLRDSKNWDEFCNNLKERVNGWV